MRIPGLAGAALVAAVSADAVRAQAYCALRDPKREVYSMFPQGDAFRSIVRTVGRRHRMFIERALPFEIHFNELGRHTLYVVLKQRSPIGLVHVRSEKSTWGLVEIAWAFDLDLRVVGFRFLRCRSRHRGALERSEFHGRIAGKDFVALARLVDGTGRKTPLAKGLPRGSGQLAVTCLRSALKTLAVTRVVWRRDLAELRALSLGRARFPKAARWRPLVLDTRPHQLEELRKKLSDLPRYVRLEDLYGMRAADEQGELRGEVIRATVLQGERELRLQWTLGPDGGIRRVEAAAWPNREMRASFEGLAGRRFEESRECATTAEIVAVELVALRASMIDPKAGR